MFYLNEGVWLKIETRLLRHGMDLFHNKRTKKKNESCGVGEFEHWVNWKLSLILVADGISFDFGFGVRQRWSQSYSHLWLDERQKWRQSWYMFDLPLARVKDEVKVISIFDFAFDRDQMCNKSNFSCRVSRTLGWVCSQIGTLTALFWKYNCYEKTSSNFCSIVKLCEKKTGRKTYCLPLVFVFFSKG